MKQVTLGVVRSWSEEIADEEEEEGEERVSIVAQNNKSIPNCCCGCCCCYDLLKPLITISFSCFLPSRPSELEVNIEKYHYSPLGLRLKWESAKNELSEL